MTCILSPNQAVFSFFFSFNQVSPWGPFFLKINLFIYIIYFWLQWVFIAACGLFSSCGEWGLLFIAMRGLLIAVASPVAEQGL